MIIVGIDENGLGPRLGPLIATAISLETPGAYDRARLLRMGRRLGIDDSKKIGGFGHMAATEGLALALIEQVHGCAPREVDELLAQVALEGLLPLRSPCPTSSVAQCWSVSLALPAFGGDIAVGRAALARLGRHALRCVSAQCAVLCAGEVNTQRARRGSRVAVDLGLFERLLLDARHRAGADIEAVLGMVGGIRDYPAYFEHVQHPELVVGKCDARNARYTIPDLGRLSFEVDADARHLPVALASMLGKYVRELLMARQNRFYAQHDAELPQPSGYHDPITRSFVTRSADLRRRLGIVDRCFER